MDRLVGYLKHIHKLVQVIIYKDAAHVPSKFALATVVRPNHIAELVHRIDNPFGAFRTGQPPIAFCGRLASVSITMRFE
jgi:hypothetical protein